MPKLSDVFLNLLGNKIQGDVAGQNGVTQASQMTQPPVSTPSPSTQSSSTSGGLSGFVGDFLEGLKQMTPAGIAESVRRGRQSHDARLAIEQAQNARANLSTLADVNQTYNQLPPGFVGPQNQGSFTPSNNDLTSLGVAPGTSFQPIQRTATTPYISPGTKPGTASVQYASRPLQRGEVTEPAVNTLGPYGSIMLGQQKAILDQANSYRTAANTALNQFTSMASKEDPGIVTSFMQGVMPDLASIKDKSVAAAMPQLFNIYKQNKTQADQLTAQGMNILSGGGGATPVSSPGVVTSRPPPPSAASNPPLGQVAAFNKVTNKWVFVPQANAGNSAIYDPLPTQSQ